MGPQGIRFHFINGSLLQLVLFICLWLNHAENVSVIEAFEVLDIVITFSLRFGLKGIILREFTLIFDIL